MPCTFPCYNIPIQKHILTQRGITHRSLPIAQFTLLPSLAVKTTASHHAHSHAGKQLTLAERLGWRSSKASVHHTEQGDCREGFHESRAAAFLFKQQPHPMFFIKGIYNRPLTPASGYALALTCPCHLEDLLYPSLPAPSIQGIMLPSYGRPTN